MWSPLMQRRLAKMSARRLPPTPISWIICGIFSPAYLLLRTNNIPAAIFSYNVKAGACPTCGGTGVINLDIQYLPDMQQTCPTCHGRRYNPEVLKIKWHERSIADLLDLDVDTALTVFKDEPTIVHTLQTLHDMGLGYLPSWRKHADVIRW